MGHSYRIRDIAVQSGLSEATVDRVLNDRGGVRASTVQEVHQAIADLDRQRSQLRLGGRTFLVDLVMQAPERFTCAVRDALEAELPSLRPAVFRCRFALPETQPLPELIATLDKIGARGSHGVLLKAPDVPEVSDAVQRLADRGVPVVTFVTDVPASRRLAYVGIDNRAAGATAAYLCQQWLGDRPDEQDQHGGVLVTLSSSFFRGEEEREIGFRAAMRVAAPQRDLVDVTESQGLDAVQHDLVVDALERHPHLRAVYSIGGGNVATLAAFDRLGRRCDVFLAHDLDADNRRLLHDRRVSAVLHHDLRQDVRTACRVILQAQGALPGPIVSRPATIQVVTPFNLPS